MNHTSPRSSFTRSVHRLLRFPGALAGSRRGALRGAWPGLALAALSALACGRRKDHEPLDPAAAQSLTTSVGANSTCTGNSQCPSGARCEARTNPSNATVNICEGQAEFVWLKRDPQEARFPVGAVAPAGAYIDTLGMPLVVGGWDGTVARQETFVYRAAPSTTGPLRWEEIRPTLQPLPPAAATVGPRGSYGVMAYDPGRKVAWLTRLDQNPNAVWRYTPPANASNLATAAGTWTQMSVSGAAFPDTGRAVGTFDTDRKVFQVLAGLPSAANMQMYEFAPGTGNAGSWTNRNATTPTPPPPMPMGRSSAAMAYDPIRKETVLFGGFTTRVLTPKPTYATAFNGGYILSDTWVGKLVSGTFVWTQKTPTLSPSATAQATLAYDSQRRRLVMFGGSRYAGLPRKTYEWDGTNWRDAGSATDAPFDEYEVLLSFDKQRSRGVAFGYYNTSEYLTFGSACWSPAQCGGGYCTNGVCCAQASCGAGACNLPTRPGQCMVAATTAVIGTGTCSAAPSGLVGLWNGDGVPYDATAGRRHARWGGPNSKYGAGRFGQAFDLNDGGSQLLTVQGLPVLNEYTFDYWYRPQVNIDGSWAPGAVILKKGEYGIAHANGSGTMEINSHGGVVDRVHVPTTLTKDTWYHFALTYKAGTLRVYMNGAQRSVFTGVPASLFGKTA